MLGSSRSVGLPIYICPPSTFTDTLLSTRSIRSGDKHRTNRMFRRRIYAQGFTIMAMFAGSIYWEGDRQKRGQYNELLEDKKKKEKHELWLKELEAREEEEQQMRQMRDRMITARVAEKTRMGETEKRAVERKTKEELGQNKGGVGEVRSVFEPCESRRGTIVEAVWEVWERRR